MTPTCVRCGRPTPDGYADPGCRGRAAAQLAEIVELLPAARDVAYGLARRGTGGGASGKPGSRLPINLAAAAKLDAVQNALTTWVRMIAEERGPAAVINAEASGGADAGAGRGETGRDDLRASAVWLGEHLEWMRHRAEVDEFLTDMEAAARVIRNVVRGPAEQKYLGPCGAIRPCEGLDEGDWPEADCGQHVVHQGHDCEACEGDVYGQVGADKGTCRICGAQVVQAERREWLDEQVADRAYRAAHIADAYRLSVNTIRSWALRGRLVEHGQDHDGRPLYLVGDVLELAREAAARRAENEAKRERRREAVEMGA